MSDPGSEPGTQTSSPRGATVLQQMGGISGLIYSSLPVLVFVPVSSAFGLVPAIVAALGVATAILVWRLFRRESTQPAISGFFAACAVKPSNVSQVGGVESCRAGFEKRIQTMYHLTVKFSKKKSYLI